MVKKPFFSVIVPAHNSEMFIGRCIQSIREQEFTDYELIIVCDACTDNTEILARALADKVIVTDFGKDGLARNAGIEAAEGEWLLFLDDDDWWLHEYVLEEIWKVAGFFGEEIDLILFDFIWRGVGYITVRNDDMNIAVWSKAFKRELIGSTRFPGITMVSDRPFMERIVAKRPRCFNMHKAMYYYNFMRPGSQTELYERRKEARQ